MTKEHRDACYLTPTQELGQAFVARGITGSVVMLNLLRFRTIADYSASPELAPPTAISGAEAFQTIHPSYAAVPHGNKWRSAGGRFLTGPESELWDMAMLVRQHSVEAFLSFASNRGYLAGIGHRIAALEDSRLLPLVERRLPKL